MTMYIPASFPENDRETLLGFIDRFPFATLVTARANGLAISHVPLLVRRDGADLLLVGHVARANDHWEALDDFPSTAVFHGPHAYVSPTWYATAAAVPTWNYAAVHVTGTARIRDDDGFTAEVVRELTARFEERGSNPWRPALLPGDLHHTLLKAIVAFEMRAQSIEGKFKLGQNRSAADRLGAAAQLEAAGDPGSMAIAAMMRNQSPW